MEPDIVPPDNGKNGPPVIDDAVIPESLITLSLTNEAMLFNVPVDVLETILSAEREFTAPLRVPTLVMLFVLIAIAPLIVPPVNGKNGPPEIVDAAIPLS